MNDTHDNLELNQSIAKFSTATEHIISHGDRISSLEAQIRHLPTTEFVRNLIQEQTTQMECKFSSIDEKLADLNNQRQKWLGMGQAILWSVPVVVSIAAFLQ